MEYDWNVPGLCSFMGPYIWHKIWGLNRRESDGVAFISFQFIDFIFCWFNK